MALTEASTQQQPGYIPRNAINHINPYFFKSHHHQHSHHHHHSPHHHHHNSYKQDIPPTSSLQTPVPRRLSVQLDPSSTVSPSKPTPTAIPPSVVANSYTTPPATPPLDSATPVHNKTTSASLATTTTTTTVTSETPVEPIAWCTARARIPTPDESEYFLHIYENSKDKKEHMAFVFGDDIRSRSLDKVYPNETQLDRVKRGAYTGRLRNTASEIDMAMDGTGFTDPIEYTIPSPLAGTLTSSKTVPLARIHSECFTGEIGHSARCDCGEQLDEAIRLMKAEGSGVVVYLRQEGRGIGLGEKLRAYNLQDLGYDTVMANLLLNHGADERTYEVAQAILEDLGLQQVRLLTNNPDKIEQIEKDGLIKVVERVPMVPKSWEAIEQGRADEFEVKEGAVENKIVRGKELDKYLQVKVERMRHLIAIPATMSSSSSSSS
ncbi:GTP cyclohydrolase II [Podila epigama]|nr:GTP cyclohydrolase II [Podila epigama]